MLLLGNDKIGVVNRAASDKVRLRGEAGETGLGSVGRAWGLGQGCVPGEGLVRSESAFDRVGRLLGAGWMGEAGGRQWRERLSVVSCR